MVRYVLVSDPTLSRDYRLIHNLEYIPCAPTKFVPRWLWGYLAGDNGAQNNGRAIFAPYALRKVEAALLARHNPSEVVVAHPDFAHFFIGDDTEIIGVHTMDPFGLGPLTMLFTNGRSSTSIVESVFRTFVTRLHRARMQRNPRAKIVVGGPGTWELAFLPALVDELHIDYAVQGEVEDIVSDLFEQLANNTLADPFMYGYQSFDNEFHKVWIHNEGRAFITRRPTAKQFPSVDEIPSIEGATINGIVEVMRGCGIGCDFCEVTLRPLRYYTPAMISREITINLNSGVNHTLFHSDETFAYQHGKNYEPNEDALIELFTTIMNTGVERANPSHGRISIPAAYPELIRKLSVILRAGPNNIIPIQPGIETASDELAKKHMPGKTLPLRIGPDGTWAEIITEGLETLNRNHWFPDFTVQIGQKDETPVDNLATAALIRKLSNAGMDFTVTPLVSVPLGILKADGGFCNIFDRLNESQALVIYSCFKHLRKMIHKHAGSTMRGSFVTRLTIGQLLKTGAEFTIKALEHVSRKKGFRLERSL